MPGLYSAELNQPRNVYPGFWFIRNTDPAVTWPTIVQPGMPWLQVTNDPPAAWGPVLGLKVRNDDNTAWIAAFLPSGGSGLDADTLDGIDSPAFQLRVQAQVSKVFADSPFAAAVANEVILYDASGGASVVDLPAAAASAGRTIFVLKIDASANTVTLDGNGAELINGAATLVLSFQNEGVAVTSDGTGWRVRSHPGAGALPSGAAGGALAGTYPDPTIAADVALPGNPTTTTQAAGNDTTRVATTAFVQAAIAAVLNGVSSAFDTLAEIATELGLLDGRVDALEANTSGFAPVAEETDSFTFGLTHLGGLTRANKATAMVATIPPQTSVAWPAYAELHLAWYGVGAVSVAAGAGVTIRTSETLNLSKRYAVVTLKRLASDEWLMFGYLEAV